MNKILPLALLLAACQPQAQQQQPMLRHVVDGQADMQGGTEMLAAHVIKHQDLELFYIDKVQPAVLACVRAGLVKDRKQMSDLNQVVLRELRLAKQAVDANNVQEWQVHHDIAYQTMGRMLDLTGAVPVHTETGNVRGR